MRELIILAMGPTRIDCPYDAEVWSCNNGYRQIAAWNKEVSVAPQVVPQIEAKILAEEQKPEPDQNVLANLRLDLDYMKKRLNAPPGRLDKLFLAHTQVHDKDGDPIFSWEEINDLIDAGIEVWNTHRVKGLKAHFLDLKHLSKKFGCDYYSDTIAYMLVKAFDESLAHHGNWSVKPNGFTSIRMYGVDMHTKDEYELERGGIEYWMGFGRAAGIDIWIHPESSVCRTHTGREYGANIKIDWAKLDPEGLIQRIKSKGKVSQRTIPKDELISLGKA